MNKPVCVVSQTGLFISLRSCEKHRSAHTSPSWLCHATSPQVNDDEIALAWERLRLPCAKGAVAVRRLRDRVQEVSYSPKTDAKSQLPANTTPPALRATSPCAGEALVRRHLISAYSRGGFQETISQNRMVLKQNHMYISTKNDYHGFRKSKQGGTHHGLCQQV